MRNLLTFIAFIGIAVSRTTFAAPTASELLTTARTAAERGDIDEAMKQVNQAIEADARLGAASSLRAPLHDARRDYEKAVTDYGKTIELAPKSLAAYQRRGEDHFRLGHFKESVADFD